MWLVPVLLVSLNFNVVVSYFTEVPAKKELCFFDNVKSGTKLSLTFEVAEGGFLDIDVRITGPEGKVIHESTRESSGKYSFSAHVDGDYRYCFSNTMSKVTSKIIMFNMEVGDPPKDNANNIDQDHDILKDQVNQLSNVLFSIKHDQEYMEVRDKTHHIISNSTNTRVVWWAFFESLVLLALSLGQVYYLKRFFEVRRVV